MNAPLSVVIPGERRWADKITLSFLPERFPYFRKLSTNIKFKLVQTRQQIQYAQYGETC